MVPISCTNLNHRRTNAPVRCCPQCGAVVNEHITIRRCNEGNHAKNRRNQNLFCVDCGELLRRGTVPTATLRH